MISRSSRWWRRAVRSFYRTLKRWKKFIKKIEFFCDWIDAILNVKKINYINVWNQCVRRSCSRNFVQSTSGRQRKKQLGMNDAHSSTWISSDCCQDFWTCTETKQFKTKRKVTPKFHCGNVKVQCYVLTFMYPHLLFDFNFYIFRFFLPDRTDERN